MNDLIGTWVRFVSCLAMLPTFLAFAASPAFAADCEWTVSGRMQVADEEKIAGADSQLIVPRHLENVEVRVSGSLLSSGGFYEWDTVRTNSFGQFTVRKVKSCNDRNIQVEVRFKSDRLQVRRGILSDWFEVYRTSNKRSAGVINIGTRVFSKGSGSSELNDPDNYFRAMSWYVATQAIGYLSTLDPWFAFDGPLHVEYPSEIATWAEGLTRTVHIERGNFNVLYLLHEAMHVWDYDHNTGTSDWLSAWVTGGTHSFQEMPSIAFHEGFAQWAAFELRELIWGASHDHKVAGSLRASFLEDGLTTIGMVERNDVAVTRVLSALTHHDPFGWMSNNSLQCPDSRVEMAEVLRAFRAGPGYPTNWPVGDDNVGLWDFLERANDLSASITSDTVAMLREMSDTTATSSMMDFCFAARLIGPSR